MSIVAKRLDGSRCHLVWKYVDWAEAYLSQVHIVLDGDPALPKKGSTAPNFQPMSVVAKRLNGSRCHLVWRQASAQATLCYMGTQPVLPPQKKGGGHSPPIFGLCLLIPNGRPSQLLLSTCSLFFDSGQLKDRLLSLPFCSCHSVVFLLVFCAFIGK